MTPTRKFGTAVNSTENARPRRVTAGSAGRFQAVGWRRHVQVVCGSESPAAYSMPNPALKHARTKAQSDSESLPIKRTSLCGNVTANNLKKEG